MKVMSYNIYCGTAGEKINELAEVIKKENPDLVGLQEVDRNSSRAKGLDITKELAERCGYNYYEFFKAISLPSDDGEKNGEYGTGILSKYPIKSSHKTLLFSPDIEQRILAEVCIDIDGKEIYFYNAHLSYEGNNIPLELFKHLPYDNKEFRVKQFQVVAKILQDKKHFVLCGDFNVSSIDEFDTLKYPRISNKYNKLKSFSGNVGDACCIDNIYYSDDFDLVNSGMISSDASDHNPIYVTLK